MRRLGCRLFGHYWRIGHERYGWFFMYCGRCKARR